jgi:hypothetical protein
MRPIKRIVIKPTLSLRKAEQRFQGHFLSRANYDLLIEETSLGLLDSGKLKFLFLRSVIPPRICHESYSILSKLQYNPVKSSHRAALKGSRAGEHLVIGFMRDKISKRVGYTAPTCRDMLPGYLYTIMPLLNAVSGLVREHLPNYWEDQVHAARRNGHHVIGSEHCNPDWPIFFYRPNMLGGLACPLVTPIFSTVTINKTVRFPSHVDSKNEGGLACLMAFGNFANGDLCLPRLRVAFRLRPGDVLFADNNEEQHGNIGPVAGVRISVVCYLKDLSDKKKAVTESEGSGMPQRQPRIPIKSRLL